MECELAREAVSANLDGERPPVEYADVERHLATCAVCRTWAAAAHRVTRRARLDPVGAVPDHAARITAVVLADRRPARWYAAARAGLGVLAALQVMLFALRMALGEHGPAAHAFHELDTFDLALAAGFLTAALRPSRAAGMLVLVGVAALGLLVTAGIDMAGGRTVVLNEAPHLFAAVGWLLLLGLARMHRHERPPGPAAWPRRPPARHVEAPHPPNRTDPPGERPVARAA